MTLEEFENKTFRIGATGREGGKLEGREKRTIVRRPVTSAHLESKMLSFLKGQKVNREALEVVILTELSD